jgi:hypothetical protein
MSTASLSSSEAARSFSDRERLWAFLLAPTLVMRTRSCRCADLDILLTFTLSFIYISSFAISFAALALTFHESSRAHQYHAFAHGNLPDAAYALVLGSH